MKAEVIVVRVSDVVMDGFQYADVYARYRVC